MLGHHQYLALGATDVSLAIMPACVSRTCFALLLRFGHPAIYLNNCIAVWMWLAPSGKLFSRGGQCTQCPYTLYAGVTSENVAAKYGIARDAQDKMAVSSHQRAAKARDTGRFKDEIVPVKTTWKDPKSGEPASYANVQHFCTLAYIIRAFH